MDGDVLKAANTKILQQIGHPPPTSVLLAVLETTNERVPEAVFAHYYELQGTTSWRIEGVSEGLAFIVRGSNERENWLGGQLEDDGTGDKVTTFVHSLDTLTSAYYELVRAIGSPMGAADSAIVGQWTFRFTDGSTLKVETDKVAGRDLAEALRAGLRR